jgi:hypothetical protein
MVGALYLLTTLVVVAVAGWVRTVLALPELFLTLLRGAAFVGFPLALAWHYPDLGHHGAPPGGAAASGGSVSEGEREVDR